MSSTANGWGRRLVVNGTSHDLAVPPAASLLDVLRDQLGLRGAKRSCGHGACGACTVLVAGSPVMACLVPAWCVDAPVTTIEGLEEESRSLRRRFADLGAFQCGYCTPGMVVRATALLRERGALDDSAVRRAISGNLCRCTGYRSIVRAIVDESAARPARST